MNGSQPIRPWHWLTILSLDAPVVALVWQDFLARLFQVAISPTHRLVLGLSVWLAYVADRWLDGRMLPIGAVVTTRHRFAQRFSKPIAVAWMLVLVGTVLLAAGGLTRREFVWGLTLTGTVFAYLAACHQRSWLKRFGWLKETAVAILISGGAGIFVFANLQQPTFPHWLCLGLLSALCLLNCMVVSVWEQPVDARQGQPSMAIRFTLTRRLLLGLALAALAGSIALAVFAPWLIVQRLSLASTLSVLGVVALLCWESRIDLETRHLLVDVTLLSPLLLIPFT